MEDRASEASVKKGFEKQGDLTYLDDSKTMQYC